MFFLDKVPLNCPSGKSIFFCEMETKKVSYWPDLKDRAPKPGLCPLCGCVWIRSGGSCHAHSPLEVSNRIMTSLIFFCVDYEGLVI